MSFPTIHPTGVTLYDPKKCWSGYTLYQSLGRGALLIDMNGKEVKFWENFHGFPNKMLPGGFLFGSTGERNPRFSVQDMRDLVQIDWDGNIVWKFNQYEYIEDPGEEPQWMARLHHDYIREGNPVGYYAPGLDPLVESGNTLLLCHKNVVNNKISCHKLVDDTIIEVNWQGEIVWEWVCNEHFDELEFCEDAKNTMFKNPSMRQGVGDWMHINSMSVLGPNQWYDSGDERFHPDNIIWSARETNILAIIDKKTGKIVWQLGPNYNATKELKKLGWIIGPHHVHMIPRGLPGEGNILIFDNGGWAGFGASNPGSPNGEKHAIRDYSRVLEFNPLNLEIKWQYNAKETGLIVPMHANRFYSPLVSSAQRLPNGNTFIDEGCAGRFIEVTPEHEIVWEYINPYQKNPHLNNMVYRAYRVPYEYVPQLPTPVETTIERLNISTFRVPGAAPLGCDNITRVQGTQDASRAGESSICVVSEEDLAE